MFSYGGNFKDLQNSAELELEAEFMAAIIDLDTAKTDEEKHNATQRILNYMRINAQHSDRLNLMTKRGSALSVAARVGQVEIVKLLVEKVPAKFRDDNDALYLAASHGHPEVVELLLNQNARISLEQQTLLKQILDANLTEDSPKQIKKAESIILDEYKQIAGLLKISLSRSSSNKTPYGATLLPRPIFAKNQALQSVREQVAKEHGRSLERQASDPITTTNKQIEAALKDQKLRNERIEREKALKKTIDEKNIQRKENIKKLIDLQNAFKEEFAKKQPIQDGEEYTTLSSECMDDECFQIRLSSKDFLFALPSPSEKRNETLDLDQLKPNKLKCSKIH